MKKILLLALIFIVNSSTSFAIEEVILETEDKPKGFNYLSDVYYGKITDEKSVSPFLRLFSKNGLEFENSKINSVKLKILMENRMTFDKTRHENPSFINDITIFEPTVSLKFNENKSEALFDINLLRDLPNQSNWFTEKISQIYVSHKITDNQTVLIGQGKRIPVGYDASRTTLEQDLVLKSQIGRNFGDSRSVGIRNMGDYKYFNYDIGLYDSTRYFRDFGNGADFTGYIMFKPFSGIEDKAGSLKIGSGYNIGDYDFSYEQFSFFTGYDYKKFHIKAEYANADGYNAIYESNNRADGFYNLISYDFTPKFSIVGRYDYFSPADSVNRYINEYTFGITYKPYKNLKFMINYIFRNNDNDRDSNMLLFATRLLI